MAPHLRDTAQLSATGSLSVSSARLLHGRFEPEPRQQRAGIGRGLRSAVTVAALLSLLVAPVATVEISNGWTLETTLRHFAAAAGCTAARDVNLAPARTGQPGYWPWLDRDNSGFSCVPAPP